MHECFPSVLMPKALFTDIRNNEPLILIKEGEKDPGVSRWYYFDSVCRYVEYSTDLLLLNG